MLYRGIDLKFGFEEGKLESYKEDDFDFVI